MRTGTQDLDVRRLPAATELPLWYAFSSDLGVAVEAIEVGSSFRDVRKLLATLDECLLVFSWVRRCGIGDERCVRHGAPGHTDDEPVSVRCTPLQNADGKR